jgi:hypothetical protein
LFQQWVSPVLKNTRITEEERSERGKISCLGFGLRNNPIPALKATADYSCIRGSPKIKTGTTNCLIIPVFVGIQPEPDINAKSMFSG